MIHEKIIAENQMGFYENSSGILPVPIGFCRLRWDTEVSDWIPKNRCKSKDSVDLWDSEDFGDFDKGWLGIRHIV